MDIRQIRGWLVRQLIHRKTHEYEQCETDTRRILGFDSNVSVQ